MASWNSHKVPLLQDRLMYGKTRVILGVSLSRAVYNFLCHLNLHLLPTGSILVTIPCLRSSIMTFLEVFTTPRQKNNLLSSKTESTSFLSTTLRLQTAASSNHLPQTSQAWEIWSKNPLVLEQRERCHPVLTILIYFRTWNKNKHPSRAVARHLFPSGTATGILPHACTLWAPGRHFVPQQGAQGISEQGEILPTFPFPSQFHCFLANRHRVYYLQVSSHTCICFNNMASRSLQKFCLHLCCVATFKSLSHSRASEVTPAAYTLKTERFGILR